MLFPKRARRNWGFLALKPALGSSTQTTRTTPILPLDPARRHNSGYPTSLPPPKFTPPPHCFSFVPLQKKQRALSCECLLPLFTIEHNLLFLRSCVAPTCASVLYAPSKLRLAASDTILTSLPRAFALIITPASHLLETAPADLPRTPSVSGKSRHTVASLFAAIRSTTYWIRNRTTWPLAQLHSKAVVTGG